MFSLIAVGVAAAYGFSVVAVVAPGLFPPGFQGHGGQVGVYFEAAAVIVVLVLLGQILELTARDRTGARDPGLIGLALKTRAGLRDGHEEELPLAAVKVGDRLRVRPGEKVPVDGTVVEGHSIVDELMLTARRCRSRRRPGDAVTGGDAERPRQSGRRGGTGRGGYRAGADRRHGGERTAVAGADPARRNSVAAWFVPAVIAVAVVAFVAGRLGAGAGAGLCADRRRFRC